MTLVEKSIVIVNILLFLSMLLAVPMAPLLLAVNVLRILLPLVAIIWGTIVYFKYRSADKSIWKRLSMISIINLLIIVILTLLVIFN